MRYRLPKGTHAVSVFGHQLTADSEGYINVPNEGPPELHRTIQDPDHGLGLRGEPDKAPSDPDEADLDAADSESGATDLDLRATKRELLAELAEFGVTIDRRRSLAEVREKVLELRANRDGDLSHAQD